MECTNLDEYFEKYGSILGTQAQERLQPLHVPGVDRLPDFSQYMRKPYPAQQHVITATVKALRQQKCVSIVAEMGTGKTLQAMIAVHQHANGQPYRALVFCPGQLTLKWEREILETIPGARVTLIEHCSQLNRLRKNRTKPRGIEWFVIARDRAKLGSKWTGAWSDHVGVRSMLPSRGGHRCPRCGARIEDKKGNGIPAETMNRRQLRCEAPHPSDWRRKCGEFLWQQVGKDGGGFDRFEPAKYIHRRMRGYFDYLIGDEIHQEKGADTAQANAIGSLIAAAKHVIVLTGTLIGGYAEHIRPLLFRLAPRTLIDEGLTWRGATEFNRRYGRIERTVMTRSDDRDTGNSNSQSRGNSRRVTESVKPGIVPTLFGRHLLGSSLYLSLAEVADCLPTMREFIVPVEMDDELACEYKRVEDKLVETNKELLRKNNRALLGAMLQCLLCYPDMPKDWDWVGYYWLTPGGEKEFAKVVQPASLGDQARNKELELIKLVQNEKAQGRQAWVFVQYTETRPVLARIEHLLTAAGLKVKVLRSSVPLAKREQWIADNCGDADVVVSHPKLVETGLELFDKNGGHNFCSIIFYETGYDLFTLRQAARRAWRIGQKRECRIFYMFYEGTMQAGAMALMGKKLSAAQNLEGKFSADGLVAMGGDDVSVEMALAKSLESKLEGDAARAWATLAESTLPVAQDEPQQHEEPEAEVIQAGLYDDLDTLLDAVDSMEEEGEDSDSGYDAAAELDALMRELDEMEAAMA